MRAWEDKIRKVVPYVAGEQPKDTDVIKLNTNENPYPPAPGVEEAAREFKTDSLRLYPEFSEGSELSEVLANYYNVGKNQIFIGVGSDDVLSQIFLTFFNSDKPVLFPDITYSFYEVWADLYKIPYERPQLGEDFRIRKEDYYKENGGVVIANPNAPTAISESRSFIEDIVSHNQDVIVVVDEAYIDFGGESAIPLVEKYDNLLVVQTFSKSRSMAGMRIGYAIGNADLIKALSDVKYSINSYTMNRTSLSFGVKAVQDEEYFRNTIEKIIKDREWTKERLSEIGFKCLESSANFLFVTHPEKKAEEIFLKLKENNIYVRYFNKPKIDNYLRITIGKREEMERLIEVLKSF